MSGCNHGSRLTPSFIPLLPLISFLQETSCLAGTSLFVTAVYAGMLLATVATLVVVSSLTEAQYFSWGWRLPFLAALPMGAGFLLVRQHLPETEVRMTQPHKKSIPRNFCAVGAAPPPGSLRCNSVLKASRLFVFVCALLHPGLSTCQGQKGPQRQANRPWPPPKTQPESPTPAD